MMLEPARHIAQDLTTQAGRLYSYRFAYVRPDPFRMRLDFAERLHRGQP